MNQTLPRAAAVAVVLGTLLFSTDPAWAGERGRANAASAVQLAGMLQRTAAEAKLRDDPIRFQQTVIGGAVTVGAQSCLDKAIEDLLKRGNRRSAGRACADGLRQGLPAGAENGYAVALQEEANRRQISQLQVATDHVQQDNQRLQTYLDSAAQVLRDGQARLAALNRDIAARRISAADAEQARQRELQNIRSIEASLAEAKQTRGRYVEASAQLTGQAAERRRLDAEIARMNGQIGQLEKNLLDYQRALGVSRA